MRIMRPHARRSEFGFTLPEILIVVVILGILAAFILPALAGKLGGAKIQTTRSQIGMLASAVRAFEMDMSRFPTTDEGLSALVAAPSDPAAARLWKGPYLENTTNLPKDAWEQSFNYLGKGDAAKNPSYDIWSNGPDGVSGTADDIGNW